MAQAVTSDSLLSTIYKTWYTDEKFEQLLWRNSPLLRRIKKTRIGGKEYAFGMLYGRGGAVSGDYTVAVANAASSSRNAEMKVQPGKIFSVFNINQLEQMASKDKKGAYINAAVNRMFAATEALRKTAAACLYGFGYGDIGQVPTLVSSGAGTMTLNYDTILKMDVGTKFQVTTDKTASGTLVAGGPYTVTAINGTTVSFTPNAAANFIAGAYIELDGGRDGSGNPNMPTGLAAWIPSVADRSGAAWTTYIGTSFYGTTRNVATDRLAGNFYLRNIGGNETYVDALLEGVRLVRRAGGVPNLIVVNDEDYKQILSELNAKTTYFQSINTDAKKSKNEVVKGMSDMSFSFSSTWIQYVIEDPYCPKGTAYILDEEVIEFVGLSNAQTPIDDGVAGNEPGRQSPDAVGEPEFNYKMIIDDYLDVRPASDTSEGPGARVSLSLYGNFVSRNPASCCVVKFTAAL